MHPPAALAAVALALGLHWLTGQAHAAEVRQPVELQRAGDAWWFSHAGNRLWSAGVNVVQPRPTRPHSPGPAYDGPARYGGSLSAWQRSVTQRLLRWQVTTAGGWSDRQIASTLPAQLRVIDLSSFGDTPSRSPLIDVFSDAYHERLRAIIAAEVVPAAATSNLLGWCIGNELPWYGERAWPDAEQSSLLNRYLALAPDAAGRVASLAWLQQRYRQRLSNLASDFQITHLVAPGEQGPSWHSISGLEPQRLAGEHTVAAFAGWIADAFYKRWAPAVRQADPGSLLLGSRLAGHAPQSVIEAMARHNDVITLNHYTATGAPDVDRLRAYYAVSQRPLLITEFAWRAAENRSGNRNRRGAVADVADQAERAAALTTYLAAIAAEPYVLGAHWFQWADQPTNGRFDGEDSNYGLVAIDDRPYQVVTTAFTEANRAAGAQVLARQASDRATRPQREPWLLAAQGVPRAGALRQRLAPTWQASEIWTDQTAKATWRDGIGTSYRLMITPSDSWGIHANLSLAPHDAAGADALQLTWRAPPGVRLGVVANEAGAGPTDRPPFAGRNQADGESWLIANLAGSGETITSVMPLRLAQRNPHYGNQAGNRVIDLQAIASLAIVIGGQSRPITVMIADPLWLPPTPAGPSGIATPSR